MKILQYTVNTCVGEINRNRNPLTFLTDKELTELNKIGYTGRNSKGVKTTRVEYLNSLKKYGKFSITQTKFDHGDFCETFQIARVTK